MLADGRIVKIDGVLVDTLRGEFRSESLLRISAILQSALDAYWDECDARESHIVRGYN